MSDPKTLGAAIEQTGAVMVQVGKDLQGENPDVASLAGNLTASAEALSAAAALPKVADDSSMLPPDGAAGIPPTVMGNSADDAAAKPQTDGMGDDGELIQGEGEGEKHFAWRQNGREGEEPSKAEGGKKKKRRGGKSHRIWKKNKKGGRQSKKRR
jgi:hypothetical protein